MTKRDGESEPPVEELQHREELGQFFVVLAARLANDRGESNPSPQPKPPKKPIRQRRLLASRYFAWLLVAAALAGVTRLGPALRHSVALPTELLGTWQTSATGYEDRSFEIRPAAVIIRAGPGGRDSTTLTIARVDTTRVPDGTSYLIYYRSGGAESEFRFRYLPGSPSTVQLNHQSAIDWVRR